MRSWIQCLDCKTACLPDYMVKNHVWDQAVPDYKHLKTVLKEQFPGTESPPLGCSAWAKNWDHRACVQLCFECLEQRLGRSLTIEDFDLQIPVNLGVRLGFELGKSS
jgi:hypothetical protein